jgi:predicted RNA-binding protein with PUA-like domain
VKVTPETPTDEEIVRAASPARWDGVRCFEARALLRLARAEGDTALVEHCERGIKAGCMAKDSLRAIADAINARNGAKP